MHLVVSCACFTSTMATCDLNNGRLKNGRVSIVSNGHVPFQQQPCFILDNGHVSFPKRPCSFQEWPRTILTTATFPLQQWPLLNSTKATDMCTPTILQIVSHILQQMNGVHHNKTKTFLHGVPIYGGSITSHRRYMGQSPDEA